MVEIRSFNIFHIIIITLPMQSKKYWNTYFLFNSFVKTYVIALQLFYRFLFLFFLFIFKQREFHYVNKLCFPTNCGFCCAATWIFFFSFPLILTLKQMNTKKCSFFSYFSILFNFKTPFKWTRAIFSAIQMNMFDFIIRELNTTVAWL